MSKLRSLIAALSLLSSLGPAFAQAPAPVPALPDSERRTSYSITSSTCACAVNFALYGDGTDFQNWVEVYLNGTRVNYNDATYGWTITSPSGPLANLARPVSNAVLTFASPQTGTVQIVGARRPRRTAQFSENRGVAARDLNQVLTDIIAQNRETWDRTDRALLTPPGEGIANMPAAAERAGRVLAFDAQGNPAAVSVVDPGNVAADFRAIAITTNSLSAGPISAGLPSKLTGEIWWDNTGNFVERNAALNITMDTGAVAPSGLIFAEYSTVLSKGTNATFVGAAGKYVAVFDRPDVTASNKGVLYGHVVSMRPSVDRNNVPYDDVAAFVGQNDGTGKATAAFEIARNATNFPGTAPEWGTGVVVAANADYAFAASGAYQYGLDFAAGGHNATISGAAVRVPNNIGLSSRDHADSANIGMIRVGTDDGVYLRDGLLAVYAGYTNSSQPINWMGSSSGVVTVQVQPAAGTYNFNLPTSAGSSGAILTSGGGGSDPMSWLTPGANVAAFLAAPSSDNLRAALTDETGTGAAVFADSPIFTTLIRSPKIIGGTGTIGAQLVVQTTTGNGTSDTIEFRGGNNGATLFGYWNAAALVISTGSLYVGANNVVGTRNTGWTAMTGTADKATTYDTSSVTLPQLAARVMALQAALTTHGLIGP